MKNVFWSILLLTLLCGVCSAATLSVDPAGSTCAYEETVNLTVLVGDVSNLGGFDFYVTWDPAFIGLTETGDAIIPVPTSSIILWLTTTAPRAAESGSPA